MREHIERGDELGDWSLLVEDGDVIAIKTVPHDGALRYSTEDRPNRADKNSEYQLNARTVIRRYVQESSTRATFGELIDDVNIALAATAEVES